MKAPVHCLALWLCLSSVAAADDASPRRAVVAVLGIADLTDDAGLAYWPVCFERMLLSALEHAKSIRTFRGSLEFAYREVGAKQGEVLTREQGRGIGEMIEAQRVVWGELHREGPAWRLTVRVLGVASGEMSPDIDAAAEDPWDVRARIVAGILGAVRVTPSPGERERIDQRWTASSAALDHLARAFHGYKARQPYSEVEGQARAAIEADPRCLMARLGLASQLGTQGKLDDAGRELDAARALEPEHPRVHSMLGTLRMMQGRLAEARALLEEARQLDADEPDTLKRLGEVAVVLGDLGQAATAFEEALRLDPNAANLHAKLGDVHARQGQREKALAALARAERLTTGEEINDEQGLVAGFWAVRETARAVAHGERFLMLATRRGLPAEQLKPFEATVQGLRRTLEPTAVSAPLPRSYSAAELEAALRVKLAAEEVALCMLPLGSTPELRARAQAITAGAANDLEKARAIFDALSRRTGQIGKPRPRTAVQALAAWDDPGERFMCQDHAVLFTVLAREAGLPAFYVEVERGPEGQHLNHACGAAVIGGEVYLADSAWGWFGVPHREVRLLDDLETTALHMGFSSELTRLRLAVKLWPGSISNMCNLALALLKAGQIDEARQILEMATKLEPKAWQASYARAILAWKEGKIESAVEMLRASVAAYDTVGRPRVTLGVLLLGQGKLDEALEQLHAALSCDLDEETLGDVRRSIAEIHERRTAP
jgi:Tfp pilus assembly protein PilF